MRLLVEQRSLRRLLADLATPADGRVALLDRLVDGKVSPVTAALLRHTVPRPPVRRLARGA